MSQSELTRRDLLRAGFSTACSLAIGADSTGARPQAQGPARNVLMLMLVGGPSQLETWDPKPDAPAEVRGPFGSIATSVAGIRVGEHFPLLARLAHRFAIIRSVYHHAPPVHEAGLQLLQTGCIGDGAAPHLGAALAQQRRRQRQVNPPFVILSAPLGNLGLNLPCGQGAGTLGTAFEPTIQASFTHQLASSDRERYGKSAFGDACLRSLQLLEHGTQCVVVNMFESIHDRVTWDCHADRHCLTSTLDDYRRTLCPTFDRAFATLLDDLCQRSMLEETLVLALGEFGRTPKLNTNGGRDHWPSCWSIVLAGGGVRGGQVIGASDRNAAEPSRRPATCPEITATVYNALGVPPGRHVAAAPIRELFG